MASSIPYQNKQFLNIHIWTIDRALTAATTTGQSEPGSNVNEARLQLTLELQDWILTSLYKAKVAIWSQNYPLEIYADYYFEFVFTKFTCGASNKDRTHSVSSEGLSR